MIDERNLIKNFENRIDTFLKQHPDQKDCVEIQRQKELIQLIEAEAEKQEAKLKELRSGENTIDEIKLQEYEDKFRNAHIVSVQCCEPEIRLNFTTNELIEIGMYLMELKHIKGVRTKTNADKIRAKSDEELAGFLCKVKSDYQWMEHEFPSEEECSKWVDWLLSEAE